MLLETVFLTLVTQTAPPLAGDFAKLAETKTSVVAYGQGYFPVLDKTPEGELVVVVRGGGGHLGIGGRLDLLFSKDGLTWYGKRTAMDTAADDRNPAFGVSPSGRFLLGFHHQAGYTAEGVYRPGLGLARNIQVYSDDAGVHWSDLSVFGSGEIQKSSPYGRIIRLGDGTLLQNVYGGYDPEVPNIPPPTEGTRDCSYVIRSSDDGKTWGDPSLIAAGHNETALLALQDGSLLAAARSDVKDQHVDLYRSEDAGRTWSFLVKATGRLQHPADLIQMDAKTVLMLFGNRLDEEKDIRGIFSLDGGRTWETGRHFRFTEPVTGDFGYPSGALLQDKLVLVHYWSGSPSNPYDGSKAQCRATVIPVRRILETVR